MRGSKMTRAVILVLASGLVAAACSKSASPSSSGGTSSGSEGTEGTMTIGSDPANDHGSKDVAGQAMAEVELDSFYFQPTVLEGTPGQEIKLELSNESGTLHNFTLEDQNVDQDIQPGGKMDVTVAMPQSGFLEFFCKYHKGSGMVGELAISS